MLIFDQLKKNDPQLRAMAVAVLAGLAVLVAGLWWVQIVSKRDYQAHLEMQSFRTVRIPAVRGKILDRNGAVLAENRATYNISLYLEELKRDFDKATTALATQARARYSEARAAREKQLGRALNKEERKQFILTLKERDALRKQGRYQVASNVVVHISQMLRLPSPLWLNPTNFERHYQQSLALPFPIFTNVNPMQIALFQEQCTSPMGVDLETRSTRFYPNQTVAAHIIGTVQRDESSAEGEDAFFSYRLPDYKGQIGMETACDKELRGKAGVKSIVVNSQGYRQTENIWEPAEAGDNVFLTLDLMLQQKAEKALHIFGPRTRGALVVVDVENGDILSLASSPTFDPNIFVQGMTHDEYQRIQELKAEKNRATQENYAPGSIFKTVTGLACLEKGLDPNRVIYNPGHIYVGKRAINDLALAGQYDFRKALIHSSNTYFISNGLWAGISSIVALAQQLHLGEGMSLRTSQETTGIFPSQQKVNGKDWHDGDTANICIGQGAMAVTPLQMAVMTAAIANGGYVLWPRLIDRFESPAALLAPTNSPPGRRVRDQLKVSRRSLQIVRDAMLADVEDSGGSGVRAAVPGLRICGKTGTAQVMDERNRTVGETTWFASFAPYEKPKYAVVVMVEMPANEGSGGGTCAPIAQQIYKALLERGQAGAVKVSIIAQAQ